MEGSGVVSKCEATVGELDINFVIALYAYLPPHSYWSVRSISSAAASIINRWSEVRASRD